MGCGHRFLETTLKSLLRRLRTSACMGCGWKAGGLGTSALVGSRNSNRATTGIFIHAFRSDAAAGRRLAGAGAHGRTDFRRRLRAQRKGRRDPPRLPRRHPPFLDLVRVRGRDPAAGDAGDRCGLSGGPADLRLKVSTISRRAAAIAYAHKLASFEPPINESVKAVMRGIRRKLGTAQKGEAPARRRSWRSSSSTFPMTFRASATRR